MKNVSVIVVAKNNPAHLFETLISVEDFASEIIIGNIDLDKKITDKLSTNQKVKIVNVSSAIAYADLIKEDLKQKANFDYILYLDPDEIFPNGVKKIIPQKIDAFDYFFFPRKNIIFGKWISHSRWWPDYQLRFFKKDCVVWPKQIHPVPITKGQGYHFEAEEKYAIYHYNYEDLDEYFEKALRYAKSEAIQLINEKKDLSLSESIKKSISEFISRFFAAEGYKDGIHGFVLAVLQMFYYFLVYIYYWEEKKYFNVDEKTLIETAQKYYQTGLQETNHWLIQKQLVNTPEKIKLKILQKIFKVFLR